MLMTISDCHTWIAEVKEIHFDERICDEKMRDGGSIVTVQQRVDNSNEH